MNEFENIINKAWDERDQVSAKSDQSILDAVSKTIDQVDSGKIRVAEKKDGELGSPSVD
jgi:2,3,4,5-tetrahydropyridine-2-carboxylate N-succinyltransferase